MTSPILERYIDLYENLSVEKIENCEDLLTATFHFHDPFNDIKGIDLYKKLLKKTLDDVKDPTFEVTHKLKEGDTVFLRWRFSGYVSLVGKLDFAGMTEISLDQDGRIESHIDYWDSAQHFYQKLPIIGTILRLIRRPLKVS